MKLIIGYLLVGIINIPSTFIKGKCFEGFIFDKSNEVLISVDNQKERYTPSNGDIIEAEKILYGQIEKLNYNRINQTNKNPIIHKKLSKYKRQYVGFKTINDEKIIWINFIWNKDYYERLGNDVIFVYDGGSYFWNVKVNISNQSLFDLDVNGNG